MKIPENEFPLHRSQHASGSVTLNEDKRECYHSQTANSLPHGRTHSASKRPPAAMKKTVPGGNPKHKNFLLAVTAAYFSEWREFGQALSARSVVCLPCTHHPVVV
jgi:hypothetical protein